MPSSTLAMDSLAALLAFDQPLSLGMAALALVVAYTIFSLTGFGSGLVASAPLATIMPVARVIPLLALLDCLASSWRGWHQRHAVSRPQLLGLLPGMLAGQVLGVGALARLPAFWLALALGTFITVYGLLRLRPPTSRRPAPAGRRAALLAGLCGGILGGLFGSGGFVYASHLEGQLAERNSFRATQAVLVALSTLWRLLLCGAAGLLDGPLLLTALLLAPTAWLGARFGGHIDLRLSRQQLARGIHLLLVASGLTLILRHLA